MSEQQGAQLLFVEIATHNAGQWNACLKALGFLPGLRVLDTGIGSSNWYRDMAMIKISGVTGNTGGALSPAREHLSRHGEGVAEVRLVVPDVPRARMRATMAGAGALTGVMRRVNDEGTEMAEAARVAGVGVQHWLLAGPGPAAGLTSGGQQEASIDYMVLVVDGADLNSAARFYSEAFGMERLCEQRIHAGKERIRSVMLGSSGWTLAIIAQEPSGAPGMASAFVQAHRGAGISHVAFRVPDIFETVSQATTAGVDFLPIQAAHYDSAPRRLGHALPGLAELQRLHVAVGRDEHGRVTYHAATSPVSAESQVTFGLVQRSAGTLEISRDIATALAAARAARTAAQTGDNRRCLQRLVSARRSPGYQPRPPRGPQVARSTRRSHAAGRGWPR